MPPELIDRLGQATSTLVRPAGALHKRLTHLGFIPVGSTPAEFRARIETEIAKWTDVVRAGNIKPNS